MHVAVQETGNEIVFLRKIIPGGMDRSYGIHMAKLAGMPFAVIKRSEEMLIKLEDMRNAKEPAPLVKKRRTDNQLPLFESPIIEELRRVNPNQLTPLQALQILSDLQARAFALRGNLNN